MEILLAAEELLITGRVQLNVRHTSNHQTQLGLGRYIHEVSSSFL